MIVISNWISWIIIDCYTLWQFNVAMERSTIFNGKIHYVYGHFQQQTVSLPEGIYNGHHNPQ